MFLSFFVSWSVLIPAALLPQLPHVLKETKNENDLDRTIKVVPEIIILTGIIVAPLQIILNSYLYGVVWVKIMDEIRIFNTETFMASLTSTIKSSTTTEDNVNERSASKSKSNETANTIVVTDEVRIDEYIDYSKSNNPTTSQDKKQEEAAPPTAAEIS